MLLVIIIVGFFSIQIIPGFFPFIHIYTLYFSNKIYALIHSNTKTINIPGRLIITAVFVLCLLFSCHSSVVVIAPLHTLILSTNTHPVHQHYHTNISEILFNTKLLYEVYLYFSVFHFCLCYFIIFYFFHDHARFWVLWIVLHFFYFFSFLVFSGESVLAMVVL